MVSIAREQRRLVTVKARLRVAGTCYPATIRNVSSRGVMAKCSTPPSKGTFVELWHRSFGLSGIVSWSSGERFGVRCKERIAIDALVDGVSDDNVGRRRFRRVRISSPARVALVSRTSGALLLDISQSGARLQMEELPRVGTYALIRWNEFECFGQVLWTRAKVCGIRFDAPLGRETIVRVRLLQNGEDKAPEAESPRS